MHLALAIISKRFLVFKVHFTVGFFFFLHTPLISLTQNNQCKVCEDFLNSFNNHDVKSLKKCFPFYLRPFINDKLLENHFQQEERYGKYSEYILTEFDSLKNQYKYKTNFNKDLVKTINYGFTLTKSGKINGVSKHDDIYSFPSKNLSEIYSTKSVTEILEEDFPSGFYGSVVFVDSDNSFKSYHYDNNTGLINNSTLYNLASCSKQFTALAILKLIEEEKLNMNDDVSKFFPFLQNQNVKLKDLIYHTSGLKDNLDVFENSKKIDKILNNNEVIELYGANFKKLKFSPGSRFDYSNTNYLLMAHIVEVVTGEFFPDFIDKNFFTPANMDSTMAIYNDSIKSVALKGQVKILNQYENEEESLKYFEFNYGDAGVYSNVSDLVKWELSLKENLIFSKEQLDYAYTENDLGPSHYAYAFALFTLTHDNFGKVVFHGGRWPKEECMFYRFLETGQTVIILSKQTRGTDDISNSAKKLSLHFIEH